MRFEYGVILENLLFDEIREKYGYILFFIKYYFLNMLFLKDYKVFDSEWVYICLYFMVVIERYKDNEKLNVLVICVIGYGSG